MSRPNLLIITTESPKVDARKSSDKNYPDFPEIIKNRINWGYNFKTASLILDDLNIPIDVNDFLLFPAGSMMWFKFDSIKQILNYDNDDLFQEEAGQEDGTTAHAIER